MASTPSSPGFTDEPNDLHTAEEMAAFLKVDPKTILNWAKAGIIPEAFRVGTCLVSASCMTVARSHSSMTWQIFTST